jgi:hypothetical protein
MADRVPFQVLVRGYNEARERFESAETGTPEPFMALFETLAWAGVLRDHYRTRGLSIPPTLSGLYYVRNRVIHEGADVLEFVLVPGAELGALELDVSRLDTTTISEWRWPSRAEMPRSHRGTKGARRRRAKRGLNEAADYDSNVARRPAREVLQEVADQLEGIDLRDGVAIESLAD